MSDFSSIGPGVNGTIHSLNRAHGSSMSTASSPRMIEPAPVRREPGEQDRVELSDFARLMDQMRRMPAVRQDLIAQVRQSIEHGTYETEDKIDRAIERLLNDELS